MRSWGGIMSLTTYEAFVISLGFFDVLYDGKLSVVYGVPWTGYTGVKCMALLLFFPLSSSGSRIASWHSSILLAFGT